jgi:hypothetical protein
MLQKLRNRFRQPTFLHGLYMKTKRLLTGELVGMTSKAEQNYCKNYGKNLYQGNGKIVDLGCWLGSTTISLAEGLSDNPKFVQTGRKIYAYDAFVWYDQMNISVTGTDVFGKYQEGESFLDEYKRRIEKYSSCVEICAGDLRKTTWNGGEIEFLLIDAMKSWELANAIIKNFYAHLIPQQSLILHQDFADYFPVWIHLLQWRLREYFEFVEEIYKGSSVVFRNTKKIPAELLQKNYSFQDFSDEDVNSAFDYCLNLVSAEKKQKILAAKVMSFIHQAKFSTAEKLYDEYLRQGIWRDNDSPEIDRIIKNGRI